MYIINREGSPVVGWPPVRAYRKNLSGVRQSAKEAKKSKVVVDASPMTMFVKVNMEGLAVGRKIDLMAHDGYGSLSTTIQKLFCSFLSAGKYNLVNTLIGHFNELNFQVRRRRSTAQMMKMEIT